MKSLVACEFFTKPVYTLRGKFDAYVLVFLHLGSRRVTMSQPTFHPDEAWVMQQARNVTTWLDDHGIEARYLIRDRRTVEVGKLAFEVAPPGGLLIDFGTNSKIAFWDTGYRDTLWKEYASSSIFLKCGSNSAWDVKGEAKVRQVPNVCRCQSLVRRKVVPYPKLRVSWKKPNSSDSQTVLPPGPWDTRKLVTYRRRSGSGEDTLGDLRDGLNRIEKASVGHRKSNICNQELQRIQVFPTEIPNLLVVEPQDADDFVGKGYGNSLGLVFSSNLSLLRGSNGLPLTLILKTV